LIRIEGARASLCLRRGSVHGPEKGTGKKSGRKERAPGREKNRSFCEGRNVKGQRQTKKGETFSMITDLETRQFRGDTDLLDFQKKKGFPLAEQEEMGGKKKKFLR